MPNTETIIKKSIQEAKAKYGDKFTANPKSAYKTWLCTTPDFHVLESIREFVESVGYNESEVLIDSWIVEANK